MLQLSQGPWRKQLDSAEDDGKPERGSNKGSDAAASVNDTNDGKMRKMAPRSAWDTQQGRALAPLPRGQGFGAQGALIGAGHFLPRLEGSTMHSFPPHHEHGNQSRLTPLLYTSAPGGDEDGGDDNGGVGGDEDGSDGDHGDHVHSD